MVYLRGFQAGTALVGSIPVGKHNITSEGVISRREIPILPVSFRTPSSRIPGRQNGEDEIGSDDLRSGNFSHPSTGWHKIQYSRRQAARDGLEYAWIDTCCIDKRSSAELQEAINSMFHWYSRTVVCYVFLTDVSKGELDMGELATHANCRHLKAREPGVSRLGNAFINCLWFSRGWTLQEHLAPKHVYFYDKDWYLLGDKKSLQCWISRAAGIDGDVLRGDYTFQHCSVAMRMSWAARRRTTRIEDRAYSILGLFDVNMPMLYGEGSKAFMRLQEEIIKTNNDQSIFVWESDQSNHIGMLAPNLDAFQGKGDHFYHTFFPPRGFSLSNSELLIKMPLIQWSLDVYIAVLCCGPIISGKVSNMDIPLYPQELDYIHERDYEFGIDPLLLSPSAHRPSNIPDGKYYPETLTITLPPGSKAYPLTILSIEHLGLQLKFLGLGLDDDFHPVIVLADSYYFFMVNETHLDPTDQKLFGVTSSGSPFAAMRDNN
ncbi:hypothetical protein BST61_g11543 [Cercospora zeina]